MRTLTLKKETLAELSSAELELVGGGSGLTCINCNSDFVECITGLRCLSIGHC